MRCHTIVLATVLALVAPSAGGQSATAPIGSAASAVALEPRGLAEALAEAVEAVPRFSGVLLVARGDEVLFEATRGLANRERDTSITADTGFGLASTGKMFTTVAVLQLVEQGRLDLDAPIGRYLPDWPQAVVRERVSARHLLTHTSGLGSFFFSPRYFRDRARLRTVSDYLPMIAAEAPAFEPGSDFSYSNSGFILLGRLVEVVSGRDYYDYVATNVFGRAGMRASGYYGKDGSAPPHVARGYTLTAGGLVDNDGTRELRGGPAGGGFSTARDLLRFRKALLEGRLLQPATVDVLLTPLALPGEGARRSSGLGMIVSRNGDDIGFGHPGGTPGMAAEFWTLRQQGSTMVLLSNVAPVPRSGQPAPATALAAAALDAIAASGGPRLGSGARRR